MNSFTLLLLVEYLNCKLLHIQIWSDCFGTVFLNSKNRLCLRQVLSVDQADLDLTEIYLSVSQMPRLKVCATMTGIKFQSASTYPFFFLSFLYTRHTLNHQATSPIRLPPLKKRFLSLFFVVETGSQIDQTDFKLPGQLKLTLNFLVLLLPPLECENYRSVPPCLATSAYQMTQFSVGLLVSRCT